jgi:ankyrin repeat protein
VKHLLLTTIAAVLLVGCGTTQQPKPPTAKAPDISIHKAAEEGNIEAVKKHLAAGTDVNARVTGKHTTGWTVLHFAAEHGHWEIAELLIDKGADVNAKESGLGTAPLHRAAFRGHEAIVERLIAEGADVNAKIKLGGLKGQTPLDIATHPDNPNAAAETADLLRKHGGKTGAELKAEGK